MEKETEKELIASIRDDPSRFGIIFDSYYPPIFNYVFRRTGDYDKARDIASETFLKAFLNIDKFRWKGISISFWLYRIASNEIQQSYRKEKYQPESLNLLIDHANWDLVDQESTPEQKRQAEKELKTDQDFQLIQRVLKQLPDLYQEVLALRYFEQKSINEIALILDKKEGTVKSLLHRGKEKLRQLL